MAPLRDVFAPSIPKAAPIAAGSPEVPPSPPADAGPPTSGKDSGPSRWSKLAPGGGKAAAAKKETSELQQQVVRQAQELEAMRAHVASRDAALAQRDAQVAAKDGQMAAREREVDQLKHRWNFQARMSKTISLLTYLLRVK